MNKPQENLTTVTASDNDVTLSLNSRQTAGDPNKHLFDNTVNGKRLNVSNLIKRFGYCDTNVVNDNVYDIHAINS